LAAVVEVVEVVDDGAAAAGLAAVELVAATTDVDVEVDADDARRDDNAGDGFSDPEHDATPSSTSGNRIRR
jgi:hypothetical protein